VESEPVIVPSARLERIARYHARVLSRSCAIVLAVALGAIGGRTGAADSSRHPLSYDAAAAETASVKRYEVEVGDVPRHVLRLFDTRRIVDARFSGLCAFRCLVPAERAPELAVRPVHTVWLGPGRHFVHYPISGGRQVNLVAIVPAGAWRTESWSTDGEIPELMAEFEGWDEQVQRLIGSAASTKRWALYDRDPLDRWTVGRISLLGDAAHPMLPFFAQGAAQAIEDAFVLAGCLRSADSASVPAALRRYEAIRRPRTSRIQVMSRGREIRNRLPDGPEQAARDAQFASGDLLRESAWLYGHDLAAHLHD
jgi:salicylate hydroxylase